jgi:hypothetical protein
VDCYFSNNYNNINGIALKASTMDGPNITRCTFESSGTGVYASGENSIIDDCYFEASLKNHIVTGNTSNKLTITKCKFHKGSGSDTYSAIQNNGCKALTVKDNTFAGFASSQILIYNYRCALQNICIENNLSDNPEHFKQINWNSKADYSYTDSFSNKIKHSSFENSVEQASVTGTTICAKDVSTGFADTISEKITYPINATGSAQFNNAVFNTIVGKIYIISFWAKASISNEFTIAITGVEDLGSYPIQISTEWKRYAVRTLKTTLAGQSNIRLLPPTDKSQEVNLWVDDIQIEESEIIHPYIRTFDEIVTITSCGDTVQHSPTLLNSWVQVASFDTVKFWKDRSGDVHLQGVVSGGSLGNVIFNLPTLYRPSSNSRHVIDSLTWQTLICSTQL